MSEMTTAKKTSLRTLAADLVAGTSRLSFRNTRESIKLMRLAAYTAHQNLESSVFPAVDAVLSMQETLSDSFSHWLRGEARLRQFAAENATRIRSASKFGRLVKTHGRTLFGSASFEGEQVIDQGPFLKLSYFPPKAGMPTAPFALFHAGGGIPYGDRIFRFLPEANFYDRFLERGIPVYAVELRGDRSEVNYAGLTLEGLIDAFESLSATAFEHNQKQKMVLEGYCGHGMQVMAFAAAKPKQVEERFCCIATFVSPYDGRECVALAEMQMLMPQMLTEFSLAWSKLIGRGYVSGDGMRMSLDMGLRTSFHKTPLGYVATGFRQQEYATIRSIEDLSRNQRRDLAGAYWISPHSARRFALPVDLVRFASRLFSEGISREGALPAQVGGQTLSFQTILEQTTLPIVGFFGGRDHMIPDRTAYGIMPVMGKRYRHVVHPHAGHISYILSPRSWQPGPRGMDPNPIDVMMQMTGN